ncbi:spore germination protein [Clostridium coskatii]|uniref:Spore germination protein B1 n=1 Tax=Clostridium coskatii TaxID=1705578 RepID=A0A166SX08_9CLOT|nr:spore germination protein [Clostridium coskatii]OAA92884.1 Spore germination protein B1 [Clostridium coskatii]OBR95826.1 spore germination protein B1 [Clostridium coskatii]
MFNYIYKKFKFMQLKNTNVSGENSKGKIPQPKLSTSLEDNLNVLKNILGSSSDIIYRKFSFGSKLQINAAIIFLEGMTEKATINELIIKPFMYDSKLCNLESELELDSISVIKNCMLSVGNVKQVALVNQIIDRCLSGDTIFLVDGCKEALIIHSKGWETRGVEEPKTEAVVRGPREGFCETMATNMTLLRRKIKNPNLTFETMEIGTQTMTSVCIVYLKGVVNPKLIKEIKQRLNRINTDAILESGYIEQFIEDAPYSIFPTVGNSEKPDTSAAKILEGRAAILVDGTPFVLTMPMLFVEGFQSAEDYYSRTYFASFLRILRYTSFFISILAPATYVMLSTFHQELIPTTLLFTMAAGREGVPFPAVMEAGLMVITFEILREAGVRLPRPVGQAVSIVGALVIGEAAVTAGLVSGLMVIVVALTAVSSFVVPVYTDVAAILRMIFLILAGMLGIFGVGIGILILLVHIASLRSFGTPYLAPLAPLNKEDLKDSFIRTHLWNMSTRPKTIGWHNLKRQKPGSKPEPPLKENNN